MFSGFIKSRIKEGLLNAVQGFKDEISDEVSWRLRMYKRKIIKDMVSIFLLLTALLFLSIAVIFFLIEYAGLSRTISFAIFGILILLVAIILKVMD
ncbi:MAG: hypothetical protein Q8Q31_05410 [Nanoarchaeota archaeon]|nr:hypothetical protein [Nanoarchaeota archaeon]